MRHTPLILAAALAAFPALTPAAPFTDGIQVKATGEVTRKARFADIELTFQDRDEDQARAADSAGPSPSNPDEIEAGTVSANASVSVRFAWKQ